MLITLGVTSAGEKKKKVFKVKQFHTGSAENSRRCGKQLTALLDKS